MRNSGQKRRIIAVDSETDIDSDLDSSMNVSQDSTMLDDTLNESLGSRGASYWKQRALEAEAALKAEKIARKEDNAKWEAKWKEEVGPLENLFRRIYGPSRGNSGRQFKYSKQLQAMLIDHAGHGIPSAHSRLMLESLARVLNLTDEDENGPRQIPSVDYFNKVRTGKLAQIVDRQRDQWVEEATEVLLTVDQTALQQDKHLALGGFNQRTEFMCFGIKKIKASKAIEIAAAMFQMICDVPNLKEKIKVIESDRERAQEAAIKMLMELLNADRPVPDYVFRIVCLMHFVVNLDDLSFKELSADTKAVSSLLDQLFGSRKSETFRKACLKKALNDVLDGPSKFESKMGKRYHVNKANAERLLYFEDEIEMVMSALEKPHPKHIQFMDYMKSQDWSRIKLEFGIPLMVWLLVAGPFHSIASKLIPYGEIKQAFQDAKQVLEQVISNDSFGNALRLVKSIHHGNEVTAGAIAVLENDWIAADPNIKVAVNATCRAAFIACLQKWERDWAIMGYLPIGDDQVLVWENRRMESSFAYLKSVFRRFSTMTIDNIQMVARSRQCHTSTWLAHHLDEVDDESVKKAYFRQIEKYEHAITIRSY